MAIELFICTTNANVVSRYDAEGCFFIYDALVTMGDSQVRFECGDVAEATALRDAINKNALQLIIDKAAEPEPAPGDGVLLDVLKEKHPGWIEDLEQECCRPGVEGNMLQWPADSVCGRAVLRVIRRAEQMKLEWPDAPASVLEGAQAQINVICWG